MSPLFSARTALMVALALTSLSAAAQSLRIAVASNFLPAAREIAQTFERQHGHSVKLISGATGKHFAQIRHGAPFDLFLAADAERPAKLEALGVGVPGTRFSYALGRLVLYSANTRKTPPKLESLHQGRFRHLAIANPKLAPYGRAARETLNKLGLWETLRPRTVRGENIAQAFQFVLSGNAELGLVALSQLKAQTGTAPTDYWLIPRDHHQTIEQQAILLKDSPAARAFLTHLQSGASKELLADFGYETP